MSIIKIPELADDMQEDDYKNSDFKNYGCKILKWDLNNKDTIKPIEVKPRIKGLGLGANSTSNANNNYNNNLLNNELNSNNILYGAKIKITSGKYKNLKALFLEDSNITNEIIKRSKIKVELLPSNEIKYIKPMEFKFRDSKFNEINKEIEIYYNKKYKIKEDNDNNNNNYNNDITTTDTCPNNNLNNTINNLKFNWIRTDIIVRIINKKYKKGNYFLKKGIVTDVISIDKFIIKLLEDKNIVFDDLLEQDLETVMPKNIEKEKVIVLKGKYVNELGYIIERNKLEDKVIIKLENSLNIVELTQNDCSLYYNEA